jgi:outer membrane receptor protein involved in Fe transport
MNLFIYQNATPQFDSWPAPQTRRAATRFWTPPAKCLSATDTTMRIWPMSLAAQTTPNFQTFDMYYWSAFAQDDLRMSERLTLNLGLRYDFFHNLNQRELANNRFYKVFKAIGSPYGVLPEASKLDFSPRIGQV